MLDIYIFFSIVTDFSCCFFLLEKCCCSFSAVI